LLGKRKERTHTFNKNLEKNYGKCMFEQERKKRRMDKRLSGPSGGRREGSGGGACLYLNSKEKGTRVTKSV